MRVFLLLLLALLAAGADRSDQSIENEIRARFAKSKIATNGFEVRVQRGVATITGRTEVIQHKGVATRLAKNGGASSVVNNIQVSERAKEKASKALTSARKKAAPPAASAPPADPVKPGDAPPPVRRATIKH